MPTRFCFATRSANILLTLLFAFAVAWWTRRRYGPAAGLAAAALCAFDPNLIAHGRYVTTDFPVTAFFFFACVLWVEYLEKATWRRLLAAAVAIGLALITKFSAVLLIPSLLILYAACWIRRPKEFPDPPRGHRRRNRVRHRSPDGGGDLLAGNRALLAHPGAAAIHARGARQPHRRNPVLLGAKASSCRPTPT